MDTGYIPLKVRGKSPATYRDISLATGKARYSFRAIGRGLSMRGPSKANFATGAFFTVSVGKDKLFYRRGGLIAFAKFKEEIKITSQRQGTSSRIVLKDAGKDGSAEAVITTAPGADYVDLTVLPKPASKATPVVVEFSTFPSHYGKKDGHKILTFRSGRMIEVKKGSRDLREKVEPSETWVYAFDKNHDKGTPRGAGGCGIAWQLTDTASVSFYVTPHVVLNRFTLKPGVTETTFRLWDLGRRTNAEGLAEMRKAAGK